MMLKDHEEVFECTGLLAESVAKLFSAAKQVGRLCTSLSRVPLEVGRSIVGCCIVPSPCLRSLTQIVSYRII